ncbi:MAG: helix-hairpin-helix domain-containing protein [Mariniblastus sp.]|nr:helix-hairpin-helix domain-containing protein [bacterium]MDC0265788.1 helix-hairpin-helix domain-containing protein [Mariniblastus sp.]MDG1512642.1 helix-hairpin-helix domain-containing protein [Mariniblastus sp.]MDG2183843.1 helix-hairpin-helix domain-containing protein [Mariniblastus sp.]
MITKLTGQLLALQETTVSIGIEPFEYEVAVPDFTRRHLQLSVGEKVNLYTIQYIDGNPQKGGRMTPRLIGFNSQIERQFFELFCSVPGLGVKKALKAMVRPVQDIAKSIEEQDVKSLTTLPGIGPAMAEKIVAQLRRKMAKFALLVQQDPTQQASEVERSIVDETFQVLLALGHGESDARKLLEEPLAGKQNFKDVEALLQAVYEQANR